jgi:hypothetical protein
MIAKYKLIVFVDAENDIDARDTLHNGDVKNFCIDEVIDLRESSQNSEGEKMSLRDN